MAAALVPPLVCGCGASDWIACRPGTARDARTSPDRKVVDLKPAKAVRAVVWCAACWPWSPQNRRKADG